MIQVTVTIVPTGKTTLREVAALRGDVEGAMRGIRGVGPVAPVRAASPDGAKGVAEEVGAFLVGVPPGLISGVFDVIKGVLCQPAQPPAEVEVTAGSVKLKFDPRRVSPDDMASLVERIRPLAAPPA